MIHRFRHPSTNMTCDIMRWSGHHGNDGPTKWWSKWCSPFSFYIVTLTLCALNVKIILKTIFFQITKPSCKFIFMNTVFFFLCERYEINQTLGKVLSPNFSRKQLALLSQSLTRRWRDIRLCVAVVWSLAVLKLKKKIIWPPCPAFHFSKAGLFLPCPSRENSMLMDATSSISWIS